jgi:NAD-dependent SIR2 family protein deacetylase
MLDAVASLLQQAKSALFITGSGLSADSDLPHYRGIPGLERKNREDGRRRSRSTRSRASR